MEDAGGLTLFFFFFFPGGMKKKRSKKEVLRFFADFRSQAEIEERLKDGGRRTAGWEMQETAGKRPAVSFCS